MAGADNRFAAKLNSLDRSRLRAAFEACQEADVRDYDRTTLSRWLTGSLPTSEPFVRCLADQLAEPDLLEIWRSERAAPRGRGGPQGVVGRFEALEGPDEQRAAFEAIRRSFLNRYSTPRSRLTFRVEVGDHPDDEQLLQLNVTVSWYGEVPARATVRFASDRPGLGDAFDDPSCLYCDLPGFDPETLDQLLGDTEQVLVWSRFDNTIPRSERTIGTWTGDGRFEFSNPALDPAPIRLDLSYPFPRGVQVVPIRFGRYRVEGGAEITLALHADHLTKPRAFPYLPLGHQRDWAAIEVRPTEMLVALGANGTVLGEGDGVVLSWSEPKN